MTDGFFKLQRRFFSHWLWKEERAMSRAEAFLDLLQLACFKPTEQIVSGSLVDVPRGGLIASERYLAERWEWSRKRVRTFLNLLEEERMIARSGAQFEPVITLCNYERWNPVPPSEGPDGAQPGPAGGPNKKKEEKEENSVTHTDGSATLDQVVAYARSAPLIIAEDCAIAFHDEMQASGWLRKGQPVHDWRAALRRWASHWNQHVLAKRSNGSARRPHAHRQEKALKEFPETRTTTLPAA